MPKCGESESNIPRCRRLSLCSSRENASMTRLMFQCVKNRWCMYLAVERNVLCGVRYAVDAIIIVYMCMKSKWSTPIVSSDLSSCCINS